MGAELMSKLKIGYWPLSKTFQAAGDRRRLIFWANARGHEIVTDLNQKVDVLIASENSDFNSSYFSRKKTPVILDLIDAYLSPLNAQDDFARGLAKKISGQISGSIKPFSHDFALYLGYLRRAFGFFWLRTSPLYLGYLRCNLSKHL
jgi:hypothetical protein